MGQDDSNPTLERPYILTLAMEPAAEQALTRIRQEYFPAERNFIPAHVTLFHALPAALRERWHGDLTEACLRTKPFPVEFANLISSGRGVATLATSAELIALRGDLRERWLDFLIPQDWQGYRAHCTLQNKVSPEVARASLDALRALWQTIETQAVGVRVWEYLGGPWRLDEKIPFIGHGS